MDSKHLRIVFAGTPEFAAAHLQALIAGGYNIIAAYTQPDRASGRGKKLTSSAVKQAALEAGIKVFQPASLKDAGQIQLLQELDADVMIVVAYGLLLPARILTTPRFGCINVHASLLPRWRGAAPIERAILAGDSETGISIMQMDAGLDTGPVLYSLSTPISSEDNSASLTQRLMTLGCQGLISTLQQLADGELKPVPQTDRLSTYAPKLDKQEALIDWNRPAPELLRQINACYPRSPAYSFLDARRIRIINARVSNQSCDQNSTQAPGTILSANASGLLLACLNSTLLVRKIQLPGKKPASIAALLNSYRETFAPGRQFTSTAAS
ncbi:MAG: methionyl-tRNA formyltransferase [Pseudohongiellaceae bacterium]